MAAQKRKKIGGKFYAFLNAYLPKTKQSRFITLLILSDHMEDYWQIQK